MDLDLTYRTEFAKTVSESDVYGFAGITGDFSPNHVNAQAMEQTSYGERLAHGVLTLGFASTAASRFIAETGLAAVSYGYDRVRFIRPVFIGDTITITYRICAVDRDRNELRAEVVAVNQRDTVVMASEHILRVIDRPKRAVA